MKVLDFAKDNFDNFPSLAQIKQITEQLQRSKTPGFVHGENTNPTKSEEEAPKFPWPNSVIGLIMGFDDHRGVSPSGLRYIGIDMDEARYLYERWKKLEWQDEWALEIIKKCNLKWEDVFPSNTVI